MSKNIFVGNLPSDASEEQIRALFGEFGTIETVNLISDRDTGRPRGFGFVQMSNGADEAIGALHEKQLNGKSLNVNEARPRGDHGSTRTDR